MVRADDICFPEGGDPPASTSAYGLIASEVIDSLKVDFISLRCKPIDKASETPRVHIVYNDISCHRCQTMT